MEPTSEQSRFIEEASDHLRTGRGLMSMSAPAGTGKSFSLARLIADNPKTIVLVPSHLAARVLFDKMAEDFPSITPDIRTVTSFCKVFNGTMGEKLENALEIAQKAGRTKQAAEIESTLARMRSEGRLQEPTFTDDDGGEEVDPVVITDESSMIDMDDMALINERARAVVAVGDHNQLPPVKGTAWFQNRKHNWTLTKVMRQSDDSGILVLAHEILKSRKMFNIYRWFFDNSRKYSDLHVVKGSHGLLKTCYQNETMILSHSNEAVDKMAHAVRSANGFDKTQILECDRLYAANNWDEVKNKTLLTVTAPKPILDTESYGMVFLDETGMSNHVEVNPCHLIAGINQAERKDRMNNRGLRPRFDYARTVHSSQGSQWRKVIFTGKVYANTVDLHNSLLYVAVTRATEHFALL